MSQLTLFDVSSPYLSPVLEAIRDELALEPDTPIAPDTLFSALTRDEMDWVTLIDSLSHVVGRELDRDEWAALGNNPGFQKGRLPANPLSDIVRFVTQRADMSPAACARAHAVGRLLKYLPWHRPAPGFIVLDVREEGWPQLYREMNAVLQSVNAELDSEQWRGLWKTKNGAERVNRMITDGDVLQLIEQHCGVVP